MALLDYLVGRCDLGLRLIVAHLNHGLRGEESDGDEELVREISAGYGLVCECLRQDVRAIARRERFSLEEAGREARYRFFADLAFRYQASTVALAHHKDDQAETVLMRLLRGSGPTGLKGMAYRSANGRHVRPFLDLERREIEAYAAARGLRFRADSSNSDTSFLRNRIRLELLPLLEGYNPSIVSRLADTAAIMAADEELMAEYVARCWAGVGSREHDGVTVRCAKLREQPSGMRLRIYRHALSLFSGHLRRISHRHLQAVDALVISGPSNGRLDLPGNLSVVRSYETVRFVPARAIEEHKPFELAIPGPGSYDLPCGGRLVVTAVGVGRSEQSAGRFSVTVSLCAAPFPWTVRTLRPGDRFVPSGMTGHKKVKDLFIDEKVPRSVRNVVPLVFSGVTLFWVAGLRTAATASAFSKDSAAVMIELLEFPYGPAILG